MSFYWKKIGSIATPSSAGVLRFASTNDFLGYISFSNENYNGGNYKHFRFIYTKNTGAFNSSTEYSQTISELLSAFPISSSGNLAYRIQTPSTIFARYLGTTYALYAGTVGGLDANPELFVVYSYSGSGGSGRFLKFGQFFLQGGTYPELGGFIDTGLLGPTSISRNGLFAIVAGIPSGGTIRNTIKVYTTSNGLPPPQNYFTAIQAGNTITIPGAANIEVVKINNAGTRLVVYTFSSIYTYELISGSWVQRPSIAPPASDSTTGISISTTGDIMVTRGYSLAVSYLWDSGSNSWRLVDETPIFYPTGFTAYTGSKIDISGDANYMAIDTWPTTNSTSIEIYEKINRPQIYKGSSQSRQAYFGANPCRVYYGAKEL